MILHTCDENPHYAEIGQSSSTRFSFLHEVSKDEYEEMFWPVKCRDFLGDAVWADYTGKKASTYDFTFKGKLNKDATKLSVHFGDKKELDVFLNNLGYIENIVTKNQLKPTTYTKVKNKDIVVIVADPFWQKTVWGISLLTYLIRVAACGLPEKELLKKKDRYKDHLREREYICRIGEKNWNKMIYNLQKFSEAQNEPSGWNVTSFNGAVHNTSGIVSIFGQTNIQGNAFRDYFLKVAA